MNQKIAVGVVYVAALFMTIMDSTIVNVALPTIGRDFDVRPDAVDAVSISFLVSLAIFIPASGWVGDRFGGRRVLLLAITIFTVASALCGVSTSFGELVVFRVIQGVGGGMMTPVGMAMLFRTFPPEERVRASSILVVPTALAPAIGPVIGGLFVTDLSWRWVFYVNVPIGVLALLFGLLFLDAHGAQHVGRFDVAGFVLAAVGLGLVMYGVSEGPSTGWGSVQIMLTCVLGAVLLAVLVAVERRRSEPVVDLRLLRNRLFRSCTAVMVLGSIPFIGVLFLVALFYQNGLGLSALQSGLSTFPEAIGIMLGAQVITRALYPSFGPRRIMAGGLLTLATALALMSLVGDSTNLWWMRLLIFITGVGMSGVFIPAQAAGFATITPAATARASTLFNGFRYLGGAIGVAYLTTVLAAVGPVHLVNGQLSPNLASYHAAFLAGAGIAVFAAVISLTVNDFDARATMVRR